jgi:competence protein ComEA
MKLITPLLTLYLLLTIASSATKKLQIFKGCQLVPTEWADGDSFLVRFPDGEERTIRLYGADCFEATVNDNTDARRLRAQRRYFGIAGETKASIAAAKDLGSQAKTQAAKLLSKPFNVTTAFADGRGDGRFKRYYGFVETADGEDLAEQLVSLGLARAFGVYRRKSPDITGAEYRQRLVDRELKAAKLGVGAWALTDWDALPGERQKERREEEELAAAQDGVTLPDSPVDPNSAPRALLMKRPGIGETMATRLIEARHDGRYRNAEDLLRVQGIGAKTLERLRPLLEFPK